MTSKRIAISIMTGSAGSILTSSVVAMSNGSFTLYNLLMGVCTGLFIGSFAFLQLK